MSAHTHRPLLSCSLALTLLLMSAAPAAIAGVKKTAARATPQQKEEGKEKKKDDKKDDKKEQSKEEKPKLSKQERKYQEIKRFSLDKYNKDLEFRDQVEDAHTRLMREHIDHAFDINTRDANTEIRRDGDSIKILYTLYDNPLAQDYVNRLGQSLVPANTNKLYAFKIMLNPVPEARSLATGTVYVSTGLLSLVDNEAQLAYILGHEIAHVEKDHWRDDVLVAQGIEEYNEKQAKKRALFGAIVGVAAGSLAGANGGFGDAARVGQLALMIAPTVLKFAVPNVVIAWDRLQEDEADQLGLQYMLGRSYDVREVPKFYAGMQRASKLDKRVTLGFMADSERVGERIVNVNSLMTGMGASLSKTMYVGSVNLSDRYPGKALDPARDAGARALAAAKNINTQMSPEVRARLDAGELIGSSAEFEAVMAELKRDNGIRALYYDMFQLSRDNLEESLMIRSNDPFAHFYYGKVLKLTARNAGEKSRALAEFVRAVELDKRRVLPEARLHRALALIENKEPSQLPEIVSTLKEYVGLYQRENGGRLPPNMDAIYDYMLEAGETSWSAPPVINISTKNIDPIGVASGGGVQPRPAANEAAPQPAPAADDKKPATRTGGGRRP